MSSLKRGDHAGRGVDVASRTLLRSGLEAAISNPLEIVQHGELVTFFLSPTGMCAEIGRAAFIAVPTGGDHPSIVGAAASSRA